MKSLHRWSRYVLLLPVLGMGLAHADVDRVEAGADAGTEEAVKEPTAERWASLVVQVYDREAASKALIAKAKEQGGWFSSLTHTGINS